MVGPLKKKGAASPLRDADGNAPRIIEQLAGRLNEDSNQNISDWQLIGGVADDVVQYLTSRRVVWLRSHFLLSNDLAALVAEIHFGQRGGQP